MALSYKGAVPRWRSLLRLHRLNRTFFSVFQKRFRHSRRQLAATFERLTKGKSIYEGFMSYIVCGTVNPSDRDLDFFVDVTTGVALAS